LYWNPANRVFDLDDPYMLRTAYEGVLQESIHADELATWLWLPKGVRRAWEDSHPQLRAVAAA
jgi:hypothetical protein